MSNNSKKKPSNPIDGLKDANELIDYTPKDLSGLEKPDENSYNELAYYFKHMAVLPTRDFVDVANELDIDPNTAIKYIREVAELIFDHKEDYSAITDIINEQVKDDQYVLTAKELERASIVPQRALKIHYDFTNPEEPKIQSITIKSPYDQYVAFEEVAVFDEEELQNMTKPQPQSYNTAPNNMLNNNMSQPVNNNNQVPTQDPNQPVGPNTNNYYQQPPVQPNMPSRDTLINESEQAEEQELQEPFNNRFDLMRWILKELPGVQPSKKQSYYNYFKKDNRQFMLNPDHMQKFTVSFFGPNTGQIVFDRFRSMLPQHLPTEEQFGYDQFSTQIPPGQAYSQQQGNTGQFGYGYTGNTPNNGQQKQNDPYINSIGYYQAVGAIPPYVNPYSPEARRMAWEYEEKARKKKERQEQREEMEDDFRMYMQQQMTSIFDQRKMGGQPGMMGGGMGMEGGPGMGGQIGMMPVQTTLPDGRTETVWMPQGMYWQQRMMMGNQHNPQADQNAMLTTMNSIYSTILQNNQAPIMMMKSMLDMFVSKLPGQMDPMSQISQTMKVMNEIGGGPMGNNFGGTIDAARVMLDSKRLDKDFELAHMTLSHKQQLELEAERAQLQAEANNKQNAGGMIQNFTTIGKDLVIPLLGMFMAMKGGGQGGGNPMAMMQMMQNMFGGGDQGGQPDMSGMMGGMPGMGGGNPFGSFNVPNMNAPGFAADGHETMNSGGPGSMPGYQQQVGSSIGAGYNNPYDIDNRPPSKWNAPPSDMYGYHDTTHVPDNNQYIEQHGGVVVKQFNDDGKYEQVQEYSPDQFMGLSLDELEDRLRRTRNSAASVTNYESALEQTIAMKNGHVNQQVGQSIPNVVYEEVEQQEQPAFASSTQTDENPYDDEDMPGADQFSDFGNNQPIQNVSPENAVDSHDTEQSLIE